MASRPRGRTRPRKATDGWQGLAHDPEYDFGQPNLLYVGAQQDKFATQSILPDDSSKQKNPDTLSNHLFRDLRGDYGNILLLVFLYILQGIPLGLTASIPLVLSNRHVSYAQQAVFSFAYWPFSLKLFWAPIVDSCFWSKIGRRKSWLVPTQYLIGIFMLVLSSYVTSVLGDDKTTGGGPNVYYLTTVFFMFNFLAATQDIAVDGWALTMLSKKNVGYASTCNAVGQTAGYFLGNVVFLALESAEFCNNYLRSTPKETGVVTLAGEFVYFWAWVFIVCTTLVLIFKREVDNVNSMTSSNQAEDLGLIDTYKILFDIVRLRPVLTLIFVHMTAKMAFAAADGITGLKLVEFGVPKDKLAFIAVPLVPLQIVLPIVIGKFTAGPKPLNVYLKAYPYRIFMGLVFAAIVYWTPSWKQPDGQFPFMYYVMIVIAYCVQQVTVYSIFVAVMAFHAQISDPLVGGTYMTLMNTVANLGGNWPVTSTLSIVDRLTWKECRSTMDQSLIGPCFDDLSCKNSGGSCLISLDGYYILSAVCAAIGFFWFQLMKRRVERLQTVDKQSWSLKINNSARD